MREGQPSLAGSRYWLPEISPRKRDGNFPYKRTRHSGSLWSDIEWTNRLHNYVLHVTEDNLFKMADKKLQTDAMQSRFSSPSSNTQATQDYSMCSPSSNTISRYAKWRVHSQSSLLFQLFCSQAHYSHTFSYGTYITPPILVHKCIYITRRVLS